MDFKLPSLLKGKASFAYSGSNNRQQYCEMQLEQLEGSEMKPLTVVHATIASSLAYCGMFNLG